MVPGVVESNTDRGALTNDGCVHAFCFVFSTWGRGGGGCFNNWTSHFRIGSVDRGEGDMAMAESDPTDAEDQGLDSRIPPDYLITRKNVI